MQMQKPKFHTGKQSRELRRGLQKSPGKLHALECASLPPFPQQREYRTHMRHLYTIVNGETEAKLIRASPCPSPFAFVPILICNAARERAKCCYGRRTCQRRNARASGGERKLPQG